MKGQDYLIILVVLMFSMMLWGLGDMISGRMRKDARCNEIWGGTDFKYELYSGNTSYVVPTCVRAYLNWSTDEVIVIRNQYIED